MSPLLWPTAKRSVVHWSNLGVSATASLYIYMCVSRSGRQCVCVVGRA